MKAIKLALVLVSMPFWLVGQITSIADGKWEDNIIWSCACIPGNLDDVIVQHDVIISALTGDVEVNTLTVTNEYNPSTIVSARLDVSGGITLTVGTLVVRSNNHLFGGDDVMLLIREDGTTVNTGSLTWTRADSDANTVCYINMYNNSILEIQNDFLMEYTDNQSLENQVELKLGDDINVATNEAPYIHVGGDFNVVMNKTTGDSFLSILIREMATVEVDGNMLLNMQAAPGDSDLYLYLADKASRTSPGDDVNLTYSSLIVHQDLTFQIPNISLADGPDIRCDVRGQASVQVNNFRMHYLNGHAIPNGNAAQDIDFILFDNAGLRVDSELEMLSEKNTASQNNFLSGTKNTTITIHDIYMRAEADDLENRINCENDAILVLEGNTDRNGLAYEEEGSINLIDNSSLVLAGNIAQTLPWTNNSTVVNLEINNTSGQDVELEGNLKITGTLTMTEGTIYSNVNGAEIGEYEIKFASTSSSNLGNANSFIYGRIRVDDRNAALNTLHLPLGSYDGLEYHWGPISLSNFDAHSSTHSFFQHIYEAPIMNTAIDAPLTSISALEYWEIGRTSGGVWTTGDKISADFTIYWDDASAKGIYDAATLFGAHLYSNNTFNTVDDTWQPSVSIVIGEIGNDDDFDLEAGSISFPVDNSGAETTRRTRGIALATNESANNPLPITLSDFWIEEDLQKLKIKWATQAEVNNHYFVLSKSFDGSNYHLLDTILGNGSIFSTSLYESIDTNVWRGANFYRLSSFDYDGTQHIYPPVLYEGRLNNTISDGLLFPNPALRGQDVKVRTHQYGDDDIEIKVFSSLGLDVTQKCNINKSVNQEISVETHNLDPDIYSLIIKSISLPNKVLRMAVH